jgi:hypothetical protein
MKERNEKMNNKKKRIQWEICKENRRLMAQMNAYNKIIISR